MTPQELDDVEYLRENNDDFITQILGDTLVDFQKEKICKPFQEYDRLWIKACHSVGKTYVMARLGLSFYSLYDPVIVITTAPKKVSTNLSTCLIT